LQETVAELQEGLQSQAAEFHDLVRGCREEQERAEQTLGRGREEARAQEGVIDGLRCEVAMLREEWMEHTCAQAREQEEWRQQEWSLLAGQEELARSGESLKERCTMERDWRREVEVELAARDQVLQKRNARRLGRLARDPSLVRLEHALSRNIARELHALHLGATLVKVHSKGKRDQRHVVVSAEHMTLRWGKDGTLRGSGPTTLDLYEVFQIHYGAMTRASLLHPDLPPWRCFSLVTTKRSFDFCCPDEATVQTFVLGLSRLCPWASGALQTRGSVVAAMGWCKVRHTCLTRQIPLSRLFREAVAQVAEQRLGCARKLDLDSQDGW